MKSIEEFVVGDILPEMYIGRRTLCTYNNPNKVNGLIDPCCLSQGHSGAHICCRGNNSTGYKITSIWHTKVGDILPNDLIGWSNFCNILNPNNVLRTCCLPIGHTGDHISTISAYQGHFRTWEITSIWPQQEDPRIQVNKQIYDNLLQQIVELKQKNEALEIELSKSEKRNYRIIQKLHKIAAM